MKFLFILSGPPYGTEQCYNALRLAQSLRRKEPDSRISLFLLGDAVGVARKEQKTPQGYYNLEIMLQRVLATNGEVLLCGTCMDARGLTDIQVVDGACRSTMDELAARLVDVDKVLTF